MRLVTFDAINGERIGAVVDNHVVDLNSAYAGLLKANGELEAANKANEQLPANMVRFIEGGEVSLQRAKQAINFSLETCQFSMPVSDVVLNTPVPSPPKVLCLGLNYVEHAKEANKDVPQYPILFGKFPSTLIGPNDDIVVPRVSSEVDYEGELVVVIGKRGRYVEEGSAMDYVLGYSIMNDVSVRDYQMRTSQWMAGKMFHKSTPVGPELVTADEIQDPHQLNLEVRVNGTVLQSANTRDMLFNIPRIISYISEICELEPGDVIATGTPSGVGFTRQPPIFLKPGDTVDVGISQIGLLTNRVVEEN